MIFKFRSDQTDKAFKKIYEFVHAKEDWFVIEIQKAKQMKFLHLKLSQGLTMQKVLTEHLILQTLEIFGMTHLQESALFLDLLI